MSIYFEKANIHHIDIIFNWLAEPFVQEFWDNTQGHKDDILNFVKGSYAIKQLSKDIDLKNEQVIKNYEMSEQIASRFIAQGIPGVCAISQSQSQKHLFIIDGAGYLVYPWVNAKALGRDEINEDHALIIARLLTKMHLMNLHIELKQVVQVLPTILRVKTLMPELMNEIRS